MPIVIGIFGLVPLGVGFVLEYLCCRLPKRKIWRALPPTLGVLFIAIATAGRLNLWESEDSSPLTQLLIFPGIPGVCALLGCYLGWRLWRYIWTPRVIDP